MDDEEARKYYDSHDLVTGKRFHWWTRNRLARGSWWRFW